MIRWRSASLPPTEHPDHDTIAAFRRRFLKQIEALFVQVLMLAREMGVLKMGTMALDGTKIHANASRHSALSYEHARKIEAQLQAEVAELMAKAEAADQADVPDGMSIRTNWHGASSAWPRSPERARSSRREPRNGMQSERADYEAKMAARAAKAAATGKKPGGRPPETACGRTRSDGPGQPDRRRELASCRCRAAASSSATTRRRQ